MAGVVREAEAACDQEQLEITQQVPTGVPTVTPTGVCPRLVFCGLLHYVLVGEFGEGVDGRARVRD